MIKKFILLALLFCCLQNINSQWQQFIIDTTAGGIKDVFVLNTNTIWVISRDTPGKVYRTTNAGSSWLSSGIINETLFFITAADALTAWVSTGGGYIYKTTNGGLNWNLQSYSPRNFINKIHFFNANTGYFIADAVNDTVGFFYTRNGGATWKRSSNAPINNSSVLLLENCVNHLDTNLIWFCGNHGNNVYKFYKLTGGFEAPWQILDYGQSGIFRYAVFKDYQNGLAESLTNILVTTNGGLN
jgi:photosystem II stability/assembly factor-like uncharacterized protein